VAGPDRQKTAEYLIPAGEAQVQYSATSLAQTVQNFERTPENTLRSIIGPCPYEPYRTGASTLGASEPHGVFHAGLYAGVADTLIFRAGSSLYRHDGTTRTYVELVSDLSDEARPAYPDQFCVINDKIIWTNGVDRARVIRYDDLVTPLGFDTLPGTPTTFGPSLTTVEERNNHYPNTCGYAWQGGIGTPGGMLEGQSGSILAGAWYYYVKYEDIHGNLSAPSAASSAVVLQTMDADPAGAGQAPGTTNFLGALFPHGNHHIGVEIDDLTRQFAVEVGDDAPEHCVAMHLYRTSDTVNTTGEPRFLSRIPNNRAVIYADSQPDSILGPPMAGGVAVPVFRVMAAHQGRLVIGNMTGDPGLIRRSEPGFPGTFDEMEYVYPDSGGAEVTALTSHNGTLLAFTKSSVYSLQDFALPVPLSQGIGCVAPRSVVGMRDGTLVWLGRDGFYAWSQGSAVTLISAPIDRTIRNDINRGRMQMAVATFDAESGEYRCALAPAGTAFNTLVLCFDGQSWRRMRMGMHIADWCQTDDWRQYTIAAATEVSAAIGMTRKSKTGTATNLYVMDHEVVSYTPPRRVVRYRSGWLRSDTLAMTPTHIRVMYMGLIDSYDGEMTIRFYKNGSWSEAVDTQTLKTLGVDNGSNVVADIAGSAVLGTAKAHDPRLCWRQIPVGLENVFTWAFEIEADSPTRIHLASFAFDISVAPMGNIRGRVPRKDDS
jgi:hypothetical protein